MFAEEVPDPKPDQDPEAGEHAAEPLPAEEPPATDGQERTAFDGQRDEPDDAILHPLAQDLLFNPTSWRIWPAVAILRWILRGARRVGNLMYRSKPSLAFDGAEIQDVGLQEDYINLVLSAPGLAAPGSALPLADIAYIIRDMQLNGGALASWLDGPGDRFMQAVEAAQARNNAAFALATGGRIEALQILADLAGRSAPLTARRGGVLSSNEPSGALGLAALFIGPVSASGLAALVGAFTSLPVEVEEYTGAETVVLRPARLGGPIGRILGRSCTMPAAGVAVVINGGSEQRSPDWAGNPYRRRSLALLCRAYIGDATPSARIFLDLEPDNIPPAMLGGGMALGGLAVLGPAEQRVRLPLFSSPA